MTKTLQFTTTELATLCNITARRVRQLAEDGTIKEIKGRFGPDAVHAYIAFKEAVAANTKSSTALEAERLALLQQQTMSQRLANKKTVGELVDFETAQVTYATMELIFINSLTSIARLAPRFYDLALQASGPQALRVELEAFVDAQRNRVADASESAMAEFFTGVDYRTPSRDELVQRYGAMLDRVAADMERPDARNCSYLEGSSENIKLV